MILVTGGSGFIGTHLCRKLINDGHAVTVIDLVDPKNRVEGVHYVRGDVRNPKQLEPLIEKSDCVYHLAAIVSVALCQEQPVESYQTNFQGTLNILEAIRKFSKEQKRTIRMAFASTAAVYGDLGDHRKPLIEETVASTFSSFYAAQKHASEQAIALYREIYGIPAFIFRFFNVFGVGQDPFSPYSGVISVFSKMALEGNPLRLNGGGTQTRDFISIHDVVTACVSALKLGDNRWLAQPTNLGTGKTITVRELAEKIAKASKKNPTLVDAPPRSGDVQHSCASIERAKKTLQFQPITNMDQGLLEVLNSL